jgi:catechol 2,3-dioxygenase-like lactoylglutathione lyase family enzyme
MRPSKTTVAHITLATRNVRNASAFLESTLGFIPIVRPGNIEVRAAWLEIAEGQQLHLLQIDDFEPSRFEREFGRHVAVTFPLDEFESLRRRLAEHGAELIEAERETPFQRFFFRDLDGYVWEVVDSGAELEGADQP